MYKPTIKELEEIGFVKDPRNPVWVKKLFEGGAIVWDMKLNIFSTNPLYLYPRSRGEVEKIIEINTPFFYKR